MATKIASYHFHFWSVCENIVVGLYTILGLVINHAFKKGPTSKWSISSWRPHMMRNSKCTNNFLARRDEQKPSLDNTKKNQMTTQYWLFLLDFWVFGPEFRLFLLAFWILFMLDLRLILMEFRLFLHEFRLFSIAFWAIFT